MEKILAPSILAADIMRLGEQIEAVKNAGAKYLHIDVMDGMFVPALSYGMCVVESIRKSCDMVLDVHLMIVEPGRHVEAFAKAGADIITIHLEACADAHEVIRQIHSCGCKAGVSIKPGTPIEVLEEYLDEVELILIMSVEPGFGGQKYIPESTERIRQTAELTGINEDIVSAPDSVQTDRLTAQRILIDRNQLFIFQNLLRLFIQITDIAANHQRRAKQRPD